MTRIDLRFWQACNDMFGAVDGGWGQQGILDGDD